MSHNEVAMHLHEFGNIDNVVHIDTEYVPRVVQKPTIHQYLQNGKIHRTKTHRVVGQFELFLDLIMVGVVHLMAENAAESFSGLAVARFALTFWGAWSIWSDYRNYANTCGMDDLPQRVYIFVVMALLIGYTANATGFGIKNGRFENGHVDFVSLKACVAFLLVAKLIRFVLFVFYGWYIREHLLDQWSHAAVILVASALYLGSMFSPTINTGAILFGTAGIVENLSIFLGSIFGTLMIKRRERVARKAAARGEAPKSNPGARFAQRIAIVNIEHATERNGGVYILVLGESITSLLYTVSEYPEAAGINPFYGRAFMVLMVSFCFNWLYFTQDFSVHKTHPIRRHWLTSNIYTFLHWPLCSGLVLSSAGVVHLVRDRSTLPAARWYWGGGTAVAVICLFVLDLLPKWDYWNKTRSSIFLVRITIRVALCVACALLPLIRYERIDNLQFLGIYASLFSFVMIEEMLGKVRIMLQAQKLEKEKRELEALNPENKAHPAGRHHRGHRGHGHRGHHGHASNGQGELTTDGQSPAINTAVMVPPTNLGSMSDSPEEKTDISEEHVKETVHKKHRRRRSNDTISEMSVELDP